MSALNRRGDRVAARLEARIAASEIELTVHQPPARAASPGAAPTGAAPAGRPASPLTGTLAPQAVTLPDEGPPVDAPVTMKCLWLDATSAATSRDQRTQTLVGLVQGATAVVRVRAADALVDPDAPEAGTVFDTCLYVESQGRRYRVLATEPVAASFYRPHTYAVWLSGAVKQ